MPRKRGQGQGLGGFTISKKTKQREVSGLNNAYRDMLAEAEVESSPTQTGDEGRPIKRRRVQGRIVKEDGAGYNQTDLPSSQLKPSRRSQTTARKKDDSASSGNDSERLATTSANRQVQGEQMLFKDETSDASDYAWEEVELAQEADESLAGPTNGDKDGELNLVLDGEVKKDRAEIAAARRKPLTAVERKLRLEIHRVHLLCLLSHVHLRNHWCNDQNVHKVLYRRLPKEIVSLLDPDESLPQFRQDEAFRKGLQKASELFRDVFTVTARGMSRPYWADDVERIVPEPPSDLDLPMQKQDFQDSATRLQGSRDVGAQLFCALLRSAGVDTRLVCSLQVLPLTATTKGIPPQKAPLKSIPVVDYNPPSSDSDSHSHPKRQSPTPSKRPIGSTGGLTRFSNPNPQPQTLPPRPLPKKRKTFPSSPHPIFWLEVFNPYTQKYLPLDPIVTHTINKPLALTPPLSDPLNTLTYAIAFSDDLTAKDVTRRYTRSYAAKVLKTRVDLTPKGKEWLTTVLNLFQYRGRSSSKNNNKSDKDILEDNELARKEASEPMPRKIQDFKAHPVYALERHLRRNEIIDPKREVGKVASSSGSLTQKSESVFRRQDVKVCRTADQWFRMGREILSREQPVKRLPPRILGRQRGRNTAVDSDDDNEDQEAGKALYTEKQTTPYIPPSIPPSGSPIPRNQYGNLDIYTPSMIPERGYHSPHPFTTHAARILGIDAVEAVTGFSFSGGMRSGKAVISGAVIYEGHRAAIEAVVSGLEDLKREEEEGKWTAVVLGVWRKMLLGLRIRARVMGYEIEGERGEVEEREILERREREVEREVERADDDEDDDDGGGFLPDRDGDGEEAMPTSRRARGVERYNRANVEDEDGDEEEAGGFLPDRDIEEPMPTFSRLRRRRILPDEDSEGSDVYVPSDGDQDEGDRRNQNSVVSVSRRRGRTNTPEEQGGAGGCIPMNEDEGGGFIQDDDQDQGQDHAGGFMATGDEELSTAVAHQAQGQASDLIAATSTKDVVEREDAPQQREFTPRPVPSTQVHQLPRSIALAESSAFDDGKPRKEKPVAEDADGNEMVDADAELERYLKETDESEAIDIELVLQRSLTEAELEEATMLEQLYQSQSHRGPVSAPPFKRLPGKDFVVDDGKGRGVDVDVGAPPMTRLPRQDVVADGRKGGVGDDAEEMDAAVAEEEAGLNEVAQEIDGQGEVGRDDDEDQEEVTAVSEKGSLLSEDPDDEDAEPDWLV